MLNMYDNKPQAQVYVSDSTFSLQINSERRSSPMTSNEFMKSMCTHPKPFFKADIDDFSQPVPVHLDVFPPVVEHELPVRVERKNRRHGTKTKARVNKYCKTLGCGNIAVSRGLCRSHGGGRRCHFAGCAKGAQSRSTFCWAHGGGCRCEAKGCMRSRKSKHFCVDHVSLENTVSAATTLPKDGVTTKTSSDSPRLPNLQEALRKAQRSLTTFSEA